MVYKYKRMCARGCVCVCVYLHAFFFFYVYLYSSSFQCRLKIFNEHCRYAANKTFIFFTVGLTCDFMFIIIVIASSSPQTTPSTPHFPYDDLISIISDSQVRVLIRTLNITMYIYIYNISVRIRISNESTNARASRFHKPARVVL